MRLVYLPSARDDLSALRRHAAVHGGDPFALLEQARHALTARVLPRLQTGPLPGLRELPLGQTPFRLICRFQDDRVEVIAIASRP